MREIYYLSTFNFMSYVYFEDRGQEIYNGHILYSHFVSDAALSFDANFMKHPV